MTGRLLLALLLALPGATLPFAGAARAHPLSPSLLALQQTGPDAAVVLWRTPRDGPSATQLRPVLPAGCVPTGAQVSDGDATWRDERQTLRCPPGRLAGARIGVEGLATAEQNAILLVSLEDGQTLRALLTPGAPSLTLPERESRGRVFADFFGLGAQHLATGADHLLFVLGLVLLLGAGRRLLVAVTSFTLGHSVTLALAVLGVLRLPGTWVEIGIAASLVALAAEVARGRSGAVPGLLARRPGAAPFGFGLLHGLGFAGALGEAGLSARDIPLALAGFNFGIEATQLALVALALGVARVARAFPAAWQHGASRLVTDAIGGLGVFFVLERLSGTLLRP